VSYGKDAQRLAQNAYDFDPAAFGYNSQRPSNNPAVQVAEALAQSSTTPLPRRRPNIEANPGTLVATRKPDTGNYGIPISGGMNRGIAGRAGLGGIPGLSMAQAGGIQAQNRVLAGNLRAAPVPITVRGGNKTQQALAQVASAVNRATYVPVPQYQPNGVANPAYRDYSGVRQSEGGGGAPQASSGSFTDSLGGVYYDRHL
jgi:hypothetical protein